MDGADRVGAEAAALKGPAELAVDGPEDDLAPGVIQEEPADVPQLGSAAGLAEADRQPPRDPQRELAALPSLDRIVHGDGHHAAGLIDLQGRPARQVARLFLVAAGRMHPQPGRDVLSRLSDDLYLRKGADAKLGDALVEPDDRFAGMLRLGAVLPDLAAEKPSRAGPAGAAN
jgi:hypothetical protein